MNTIGELLDLSTAKVKRLFDFTEKYYFLKYLVFKKIWSPKKILLIIKFFLSADKHISAMYRQKIYLAALNDQYNKWIKKHYPSKKIINTQKKQSKEFIYKPKISIIIPTYNTPDKFLRECIGSVINQTYWNWEICIVDDASTDEKVREIIKEYASSNKKIKYSFRSRNGHISKASNDALKLASGEFIGLLDHDDSLWPNALYEVAKVINKDPTVDFIYSDEDKLEEDGKTHTEPFLKPDWSPDYLRSINYIAHFSVVRKKIVDEIGGFRPGFEGAQDWDLFLRITRRTDNIVHIPSILYSWRKSPVSAASGFVGIIKKYAYLNQKKVLEQDLRARRLKGDVYQVSQGLWRIKCKIKGNPLVSIVVPTKDKYGYISDCLKSIVDKTTYRNYEIIIIDTGSTDKRVWSLYEDIKTVHRKTKVLKWRKIFNFSKVCNYGASGSKGRFLVFLNNDTKVLTPDWIESMLEHAQRSMIGAVGCKLLYPNGTIQHVGIVVGLTGFSGHIFQGLKEDGYPYVPFGSVDWVRNYTAVTAACMMIEKKKYIKSGKMDEQLSLCGNDVELCLRLNKQYTNLYTPFAKLIHHESVTRKNIPIPIKDYRRSYIVYKEIFDSGDRYFNKNLSLLHSIPAFSDARENSILKKYRKIWIAKS